MALTPITGEIQQQPLNDNFSFLNSKINNFNIFNVKDEDYGAVGDGATDDTAAIQAAIDDADGTNGIVFFPSGTYKVTTTLTASSGNFSLVGSSSRNATILHSGDYGDTMFFERSTPLTNRIGFITVENLRFFVDSSATLPSSGAHLHFNRPQAVELKSLDISEMFGGIHFEGGAGVIASNLKINSGQFYSGSQAGSYLVKFESATTDSSNEMPAEYVIANFNIRSSNTYIENAIIIEASDGLWFSNGHVGFTSNAGLKVNPTVATDSLNGINFSNVHFDGNNNTSHGVEYIESVVGFHTGACFGHTFTGCQFSIHASNGMRLNLDSLTGLEITGGRINDNDAWGIRMSRGEGLTVSGVLFKTNGDNTSGTGHILFENDVEKCNIDGIFKAITYRGIQLTGTANNINVNGVFNQITADDIITSSSNINNRFKGITDKSNSIASTAALTLPLLGDYFEITGTTNITSIGGASRYEGRIATLKFTNVLTFTDGSNLKLSGNFVTSSDDTITLVCSGSNWYEISRSTN